MSSGNGITFVTNSTGTYVVSSDASKSSAKIIRSDILLEGGGVLHVVDRLLASATLEATNAKNTTAAPGQLASSALPALSIGSPYLVACLSLATLATLALGI
jgi:hypothetical protein